MQKACAPGSAATIASGERLLQRRCDAAEPERLVACGLRDPVVAKAGRHPCSSVLHRSHVLIIQGDSFRLRQKKRAGLLGSSKTSH